MAPFSQRYAMKCIFLILALSCVIIVPACGRKAPPLPPSSIEPPVVGDIEVIRKGNTVELSWPVPDWEGGPSNELAGFFVYRGEVNPEQDCEGCPVRYTRVADVRLDEMAALFGDRAGYTDTVEPGGIYKYQVTSYTQSGSESEPSETITIDG